MPKPRTASSPYPDPILRQRAAALHLGVSASCLRKWDHLGIGPKRIRVPGTRVAIYRLSALDEWARRNEVDSANAA